MGRRQRPAEIRAFVRRLTTLGIVVVGLLAAGTAGFTLTLHDNVWDAFQRALDTVATTGAIPAPTDTGAQIVRSILTILGVGTLFYALVSAAEFFVAGHVADLLRERRRQRTMDALTDHYLICGFGRVGRQVARDLRAAGARYVIIDDNPENREVAESQGVGVRYLDGTPSDDEVLRAAGIERARGVVACVDSDAENVFITLTARGLRPDVEIVARASQEASEQKLQRAGADRVVSPYKSSGAEMARLALHPYVSGVVDVAPEYRMEEIEVAADCQAAGRAIADIRGGAIIVAIRRADGTFQAQPPSETVLRPGDVIVALGTAATMTRLEALFAPASKAAGPA
jgi:voltage-gated potassium channel